MTSPPLSETGPSAEEQARELILLIWGVKPCNVAPEEFVERMIRDGVAALMGWRDRAKRSAHLEDARAGCYACRDTVNYRPASQEPDHDRWVHVIATRSEWGCVTCERPEAWDALSLTGPTTKSTASEQQDGKTR